MANYIKELASDLMTRLPELEWKITNLNPILFSRSIPKRLFRTPNLNPLECINELKVDIQVLTKQNSEISALYLVGQIKQKINVLVGLCRMEKKQEKLSEHLPLGINTLSTRQQWLRELEQDIESLSKQQQALLKTLSTMKMEQKAPSILLNLQSELGTLEKRLTLAKETLAKATSVQVI
jgi:hypothetical protein